MSSADLVLTLLDKHKLEFETLRAPDAVSLREDWLSQTVPLHSVARLGIFRDSQVLVLAFYPADNEPDPARLNSLLHRTLEPVNEPGLAARLNAQLQNAEIAERIQIIIDEQLTNQEYIHFEAPGACTLLRVASSELHNLSSDVLLGSRFCRIVQFANPRHANRIDLRKRITQLDRLPAMPDMPSRILAIRNNPDSTVDDLVRLIEHDLALASQIIRYANSAMFSPREKIVSLKDAIFRVLGYETVLHLSLGYALGRVFKLPEQGPLGHTQFWRHASYSAALAQHLAGAMPRHKRPQPGMAYLAGLLHDIGFLVLNLFFRHEHAWLNKMLMVNTDTPILHMEQRLLGITHPELGSWLMQAWQVPSELCVTVREHHNLHYRGEFAEYAQLVQLTERLLKMHGMSDADTDEIPAELLDRLGLEEETVFLIMDEVLSGGETLREMAFAMRA